MKFADLSVGQVIVHGPLTLSEDDITTFAARWDPQWFHTDPAASAAGPFKGLIASGWQTCAVAMRLAYEAVLVGSESFGSPGVAYIKWPRPLRPREPVTLHAEVLEVRCSDSRPDLGILRWRWQLKQADGEDVMDLEVTSLFDLSPRQTD